MLQDQPSQSSRRQAQWSLQGTHPLQQPAFRAPAEPAQALSDTAAQQGNAAHDPAAVAHAAARDWQQSTGQGPAMPAHALERGLDTDAPLADFCVQQLWAVRVDEGGGTAERQHAGRFGVASWQREL